MANSNEGKTPAPEDALKRLAELEKAQAETEKENKRLKAELEKAQAETEKANQERQQFAERQPVKPDVIELKDGTRKIVNPRKGKVHDKSYLVTVKSGPKEVGKVVVDGCCDESEAARLVFATEEVSPSKHNFSVTKLKA